MSDYDGDLLWICTECIGENYLKDLVFKGRAEHACSYCERVYRSISIEELADRVEQSFGQHYRRTSAEMDSLQWQAHKDRESDYEWEREGDPTIDAIQNAALIDEEPARDVQRLLDDRHGNFDHDNIGEETEFAEEAHYQEVMPESEEWLAGWLEFVRVMKVEARFFSQTAAKRLGELFDGIDKMRTVAGDGLIVSAGPGTERASFYRARVFQSDDEIIPALARPDHELSAPPSNRAAAGRMNAKGISVFYGATTPQIAIAEVRPPVGADVATARFDVIRPLRLLDLTKLKEVHEYGSIFDPDYARRLSRMLFLRTLCERISQPVMPNDQELEYLPTQAVADFLATSETVPLDGILFPSVQVGGEGLNVVLFHKASACEEFDLPKGTRIEARTGQQYAEGWEREFTVIEWIPENVPKPPADVTLPSHPKGVLVSAPDPNWLDGEPLTDYRPATLRVDIKSLRVHRVRAVEFQCTEQSVYRHQIEEKSDLPF